MWTLESQLLAACTPSALMTDGTVATTPRIIDVETRAMVHSRQPPRPSTAAPDVK